MREYNLFAINNEYVTIYKNKPYQLFSLLRSLYYMNNDFNYGITCYNQLCTSINTHAIRYYLNSKYELQNLNKFYIDESYIQLKPSRIVLFSRYNIPNIITVFNCYHKNMFVCDFQNNDYFWLSNIVKNTVLQYL